MASPAPLLAYCFQGSCVFLSNNNECNAVQLIESIVVPGAHVGVTVLSSYVVTLGIHEQGTVAQLTMSASLGTGP